MGIVFIVCIAMEEELRADDELEHELESLPMPGGGGSQRSRTAAIMLSRFRSGPVQAQFREPEPESNWEVHRIPAHKA
jgi:hypothetical protein